MKKNLLFLLCVLSCSLAFLSSCKDDKEPEVPPTVDDIVAEYSSENLKTTIEGVDVTASDVKIDLAKGDAADKVTIILHNVVPGTPEFRIPDADFVVTTRSAYISTLKGEVTDNVAGYNVKVDGTVDNKVLTVSVVVKEVEGVNTKTEPLIGLVYKGDMKINVSNISEPISMEQRVYITKARSSNMAKRDTSMVKLTIKNFTFQGLELGSINVDTILVQKRGEVFAFKAANRKIKIKEPIGEVNADLNGTIVGEKINLSLDIAALTLKINVGFEGQTVTESQEAKITKMAVDGDAVVESKLSGAVYTFKVWDNASAEQLTLTPKYELSEKAKVDSVVMHIEGQEADVKLTAEQAQGKQPIDFSKLKSDKDYVRYFLVAEDPNITTRFTVKMERLAVLNPVYDMQTWVIDAGNKRPTPKGLTNSNAAANFFPMFEINVDVPVVKAADGAAEITTSRTVSEKNPNGMVPGVTAGTLFLGAFSLDLDVLKSTHFGEPYTKKPVSFKMTYKYTPGATYYKTVVKEVEKGKVNDTEVVPNTNDECSINAYLYEVSNYDETLDGTNINTSSKVILKAVLADGTAKSAYTTETIQFKETGNGSFDPAKKYKLAIVCSSSKRGDEFMGADGSKLWVKYLEVIGE